MELVRLHDRDETQPFEESERVLRLYDRAWASIAEQARIWLRENPDASSSRLAAAIEQTSSAAAERCRRDAWAIDSLPIPGDLSGGGDPVSFEDFDPFYDSCWAVDATAVRLPGENGYTYAAFVTFGLQGRMMLLSTSGVLPQYAVLPRGPGGIRTLPDDAQGRHRFFVDARPADNERMGATACRQLAVFGWDGHILEGLVDFHYSTFKGTQATWDGRALGIETKGEIRSFGTCGACNDLNAEWRLDVTPQGVHAHELTYDEPLFPLVDEFIARVQDGTDWQELGSSRAGRDLAALLSRRSCERPCAFGFVSTSVTRAGAKAVVSLALHDEPRGAVAFTITRGDDRAYVEAVRFASPTRP
jgi:hypothetical protein